MLPSVYLDNKGGRQNEQSDHSNKPCSSAELGSLVRNLRMNNQIRIT